MNANLRIPEESFRKTPTMKWVYEFSVWPAEHGFCKSVYVLFEQLMTRVQMEFTEEEFEFFRESINQHGITLREIERFRYQEKETVL